MSQNTFTWCLKDHLDHIDQLLRLLSNRITTIYKLEKLNRFANLGLGFSSLSSSTTSMIEFRRCQKDQFTDPYTFRDKKGIPPSYYLHRSQMFNIQRLLNLCYDAIFDKNLIRGVAKLVLTPLFSNQSNFIHKRLKTGYLKKVSHLKPLGLDFNSSGLDSK